MTNIDAVLDEIDSSETPVGRNAEAGSQPGHDTEVVCLRGLRGYNVQIEYLEARIQQEESTPSLWLVDNLAVGAPPNSNEVSRLIGLAWQQKSRLRGARVAWVASQRCALDTKMLLSLPITLRTFKTVEAARAWLLEEA